MGFILLWFIVFSCFIKVFIQIERGRYAISEGVSTLDALNSLPGPKLIVNWCVILWTVMWVVLTGVGASELIYYPIWCLEKGYARFVGPREDTEAWVRRAQSWIHVMKVDAWVSMVIYTISTVAFYLLGAAILHNSGKTPEC